MGSGAGHEIEIKRLLIGDRGAERLMAALGIAVELREQVNHVFDTDRHALHRARHVVRLRIEPSATFLTAKGPGRMISKSGASRTEAETRIARATAEEVLAGRVDPVALLRSRLGDPAYDELWKSLDAARAGQPVKPIGHFVNERTTVPVTLPTGRLLELEIDRTRFQDGRFDEEVELEVPAEELAPEAEAWLEALLKRAGVESTESTPKIVRFYAALGRSPAP